MLGENQNSWNEKWEAQMDKVHGDLLELNETYLAAERRLSQVHLEIRATLLLMELIAAQIVPPE